MNEKKEYKALVLEAEVITENGTFYTTEAVRNAFEKMKVDAEKGQLYGELDHPYQNDFRIGFVSLERLAVQWNKLEFDGKRVYGTFVVLPTPYGNLVKNLIENNINFGFSLRGSGKTRTGFKENRKVEIVEDFYVNAIDVVAVPSFQNARILAETKGSEEKLKISETIERVLFKYL